MSTLLPRAGGPPMPTAIRRAGPALALPGAGAPRSDLSYRQAGWMLAGVLLTELRPRGVPPAEWADRVAVLDDLLEDRDAAAATAWLQCELPPDPAGLGGPHGR